jgi:hypothetical protein
MSVDPGQADPGATAMTKVIHPDMGTVAEVPESSVGQWYAAGWTLLTEDNAPAEEPAKAPEPMTREQAAKASGGKAAKSKEE